MVSRLYKLLTLVVVLGYAACAQVNNPSVLYVNTNPSGTSCTGNAIMKVYQGTPYTCQPGTGAGTYQVFPTSGSAGVSTFNGRAGVVALTQADVTGVNGVTTGAGATFGAFTYDFSGSTAIKVPIASGFAPTTLGSFGVNNTNNVFVGGNGTSTLNFAYFIGPAPGSGNCVQTGSNPYQLTSTGLPCGSGSGGGNVSAGATLPTGDVIIGASAFNIADSGKAAPSGQFVGTTDLQAITGKSIDASEINSGVLSRSTLPSAAVYTDASATFGGFNYDFANAAMFRIQVGTSNPATCSVGQILFRSDQPAGQNVYGCASANTWTAQGGSGSGITQLTGDVTAGPGSGSVAATLATVVTPGTFSNPTVTVDAKGRVTSIVNGSGPTNNWSSGALSSIPATCSVGSGNYLFFASDQPIGQQIYVCTATNVWSQFLNLGGSGALQFTSGALDINTAIVPRLAAANTWTGLNSFATATGFSPTVSTSNPGTCSVGQLNFRSDVTAGQNVYGCTSTNTWTQEAGGGGGTASYSAAFTATGGTQLNIAHNVNAAHPVVNFWDSSGNVLTDVPWTLQITTLNGTINASTTSVVVTSAANFANNDYIQLDSETMLVTGIASNTLTVTRAQQGTTAASHTSGAGVMDYNLLAVTFPQNQSGWILVAGSVNTGAPSGPAGGALSGTYPNPTIKGGVAAPGYDLSQMGLKGDNSTDNLAAYNTAYAAIVAAGGGRMWLPAGSYKFSGALVISDPGVELECESHYPTAGTPTKGTRIVSTSTTDDIIRVQPSSRDMSGNAIRNCHLEGNQSSTIGDGINIVAPSSPGPYSVVNLDISDVTMDHIPQDGIAMTGYEYPGTGSIPGNAQVTWRVNITNDSVYTVGRHCYAQYGWVEQVEYQRPYCGIATAGDAFHIDSGLFPSGSAPLSYNTRIVSPSLATVSGYDYYLKATQNVTVVDSYNDIGTNTGYAYLDTTYITKFQGIGHGIIGGSQTGFAFANSNAGCVINVAGWINSSSHKSLTANSGSTISDCSFGYYSNTNLGTVLPFTTADWEGSGTHTGNYYTSDTVDGSWTNGNFLGTLGVTGAATFGSDVTASGTISGSTQVYSASNVRAPYLYGDTAGGTALQLTSTGTDYGKVENTSAHVWDLGHGTSGGTALGTPVIEWTDTNLGIVGARTFVTSDFTTAANTNLQNITGLAWTLPANTALNVPFQCHLAYDQGTSTAAVSFGISASVAPTNIFAIGEIFTNTNAFVAGNLPTLNTTTATAIVTGTPSAITTVWNAQLNGFIENPSQAASTINIMVKTATSADAVVVKRGSFCVIQ